MKKTNRNQGEIGFLGVFTRNKRLYDFLAFEDALEKCQIFSISGFAACLTDLILQLRNLLSLLVIKVSQKHLTTRF
jgi:hypothetical protein